jgi:hypothetical protein
MFDFHTGSVVTLHYSHHLKVTVPTNEKDFITRHGNFVVELSVAYSSRHERVRVGSSPTTFVRHYKTHHLK